MPRKVRREERKIPKEAILLRPGKYLRYRGLKRVRLKSIEIKLFPAEVALNSQHFPRESFVRRRYRFHPRTRCPLSGLKAANRSLTSGLFPAINVPRRSDVPRPWAGGMSRGMFSARKGRQGDRGRWNVTRWTFSTHTDRLRSANWHLLET